MIVIFIALIILYLGVILFVGTTFVKISLFAMDKLAVFIASWYYTHHYFFHQVFIRICRIFLGYISGNSGCSAIFCLI